CVWEDTAGGEKAGGATHTRQSRTAGRRKVVSVEEEGASRVVAQHLIVRAQSAADGLPNCDLLQIDRGRSAADSEGREIRRLSIDNQPYPEAAQSRQLWRNDDVELIHSGQKGEFARKIYSRRHALNPRFHGGGDVPGVGDRVANPGSK